MWKDDYVFPVEPKGNLLQIIEKLSALFSGEETLFVVDDVIADETLDKRRQPLLELAMYSAGKNTVIAAGADLVYDYGKKHKY